MEESDFTCLFYFHDHLKLIVKQAPKISHLERGENRSLPTQRESMSPLLIAGACENGAADMRMRIEKMWTEKIRTKKTWTR
mgnify:CR=1 FL=1